VDCQVRGAFFGARAVDCQVRVGGNRVFDGFRRRLPGSLPQRRGGEGSTDDADWRGFVKMGDVRAWIPPPSLFNGGIIPNFLRTSRRFLPQSHRGRGGRTETTETRRHEGDEGHEEGNHRDHRGHRVAMTGIHHKRTHKFGVVILKRDGGAGSGHWRWRPRGAVNSYRGRGGDGVAGGVLGDLAEDGGVGDFVVGGEEEGI
jgi:hypothetical protein